MFYINRLNNYKKTYTLTEVCSIEPQNADLFNLVSSKFPSEILDLDINVKNGNRIVYVNFQKELDRNGHSERIHAYISNGTVVNAQNGNSLKNWK